MQIIIAWLGGVVLECVTNVLTYSPAVLIALLIHDMIKKRHNS